MYGTTLNACKSSSNSSIVLDRLEPCTIYHINITSVSVSGQISEDSLLFDTNTDDAGTFLIFCVHECMCRCYGNEGLSRQCCGIQLWTFQQKTFYLWMINNSIWEYCVLSLLKSGVVSTAPGAPRNLRVNNQTEYMVSLAWDNPKNRASCVDKLVLQSFSE